MAVFKQPMQSLSKEETDKQIITGRQHQDIMQQLMNASEDF